MIKSFIIIAIRNLSKNLTFSLINLFGLSFSIALFILLALYINSELSTDKHIDNVDNIYSLLDKKSNSIFTNAMFAEFMSGRYPEVKTGCTSFVWDADFFVEDGHSVHFEHYGAVDSTYFKMFKNKAILGSLDHALDGRNGMVLTESAAKALFRDQNPIGEVVSMDNEFDFVVNAVIPDIPANSFYQADCFFSIQSFLHIQSGMITNPGNFSLTTFVELYENADVEALEEKISKDIMREFERDSDFGLIPYSDLYFSKVHIPEEFEHGNKQFVYLFLGIAVFIIVIASINYINLTTAKSVSRAREIGIRKVVGAFKRKLIIQFLTESIILILISMVIGFLLAELFIGEFNLLAQTNFQVKQFYNFPFNILFVLGAIVLGIISGIYPALVLTSFKTTQVIKGKITRSKSGVIARKVLMVFQFVISFIMMVGAIVIFLQIKHVKHKDVGFNKENVIRFKTKEDNAFEDAQAFKNELLTIAGVEQVSFCYAVPGEVGHGTGAYIDGEVLEMRCLEMDNEYVELMGLEIVDGRNFTKEDKSDYKRSYLINEAAVREFGWDNPYEIKFWKGYKLVGIVKDFNFESLHLPVKPLFMPFGGDLSTVSIRISEKNQEATIQKIEEVWSKRYPEFPFTFQFLDQIIGQQYKDEQRLGKVVTYFSIFALLIACMGLLGMTSYMIQQKHREIGIRKVHGGAIMQIVKLLSFDFVKWVFVAFVVSVPVSYWIMKQWLAKNFISQVSLDWWIFLIVGVTVILVSLVTIGIQSYRAAVMNPVDSLRYE